MTTSSDIEKIKTYLKGKDFFTYQDIQQFYQKHEPDININTLRWRIHNFKNNNLIKDIKRGVYTFIDKPFFRPEPDNLIKRINNIILNGFSVDYYNIWSTEWLNEFTIHQVVSHQIIVETDKEALEPVFHNLKDKGLKNVYLSPDQEVIEKYILEENLSIIVKPMISRAPINKVNNITLASLEKILIDLFCDQDIFKFYAGNELINIYQYALKNYTINFSILLNYSSRRSRKKEIHSFLLNNFNSPVINLLK